MPVSKICFACNPEVEIHLLSRLLFVTYFLEAGLVLIVAPWSVFWDRNLFIVSLPLAGDVLTNNFLRGAISGVGMVTVVGGFLDLAALIVDRSGLTRERRPVVSYDIRSGAGSERDCGSTMAGIQR